MSQLVSFKTNHADSVRISAQKRDCVENIVHSAAECSHIEQIILFGSALEERCRKTSDIDIAIISDIPKSKLFRLKSYDRFARNIYMKKTGQSYDILVFFGETGLMKDRSAIGDEIRRKGKAIYRRKTANV